MAAKLAQYRENCSSRPALSKAVTLDSGERSDLDTSLDTECTIVSLSLRQPHNTHTIVCVRMCSRKRERERERARATRKRARDKKERARDKKERERDKKEREVEEE